MNEGIAHVLQTVHHMAQAKLLGGVIITRHTGPTQHVSHSCPRLLISVACSDSFTVIYLPCPALRAVCCVLIQGLMAHTSEQLSQYALE